MSCYLYSPSQYSVLDILGTIKHSNFQIILDHHEVFVSHPASVRKGSLYEKHVISSCVTRGYKGLQGVTGGYKGLQEVTGGYKGLHGVTRGYIKLHRVTEGYKRFQGATGGYNGLQEVTRGYKWLEGVTGGYRG